MVLAQNLTLSFSSESSIQDELNRESTADAITIVVNILYTPKYLTLLKTAVSTVCLFVSFDLNQISYILMFAYISFTLGDRPSRWLSLFVSSKVRVQ